MTESGPAVLNGALLARKGSASPAGFKSPAAQPPQPAAPKPERRGAKFIALWILPTVAIAVAATLAAQLILARDNATIAAAPPKAKPTKIEPSAAGEFVEAPGPQSVVTQLAALKIVPVDIPIAAREPPPPPMPPADSKTPEVQAQPPPAAKPIYRVQLHALGSRATAQREWRKIQSSHDDLFGRNKMTLLNGVNKASGAQFVRLQAGPFDGFRAALKLCSQAKKRRIACVMVQQ